MKNTALLLIECQNEWLAPTGKLRKLVEDEEQLILSERKIESALQFARNNKGIHILHVTLRLHKGYPEFGGTGKAGLQAAIPKAQTWIIGEEGEKFYPKFAPLEGEFEISGRMGASAFAGTNLDAYLRNNKIENLYLAGYALHVCVESTLREAHDKGYNTTVLLDATAAFTKEQRQYFIDNTIHHFGHQINTDTFLTL
ncbi:cysteine hydrolase [Aquimarina hainanensis]|uniref:Cysteine hydrolase n=1 Tax=Aquimarina hainanensis TaxID=1578017 RepID=A0ABW5N6V9_9FLAO